MAWPRSIATRAPRPGAEDCDEGESSAEVCEDREGAAVLKLSTLPPQLGAGAGDKHRDVRLSNASAIQPLLVLARREIPNWTGAGQAEGEGGQKPAPPRSSPKIPGRLRWVPGTKAGVKVLRRSYHLQQLPPRRAASRRRFLRNDTYEDLQTWI